MLECWQCSFLSVERLFCFQIEDPDPVLTENPDPDLTEDPDPVLTEDPDLVLMLLLLL